MSQICKIDLVIPLYNRAQMIPGLIATLEGQNLKDFRVIFVDDGSTDNTYEAMESALKNVSFSHLLLHQENQGPSAARNFGVSQAQAEWVAFMDSDDELKPEYLEYLYQAVANKDVQMGFCHLEMLPVCSDEHPNLAGVFSCHDMTAAEAMQAHYTSWIAPVCLILNLKWLQENQLKFDIGCRYCEDLMFITECIVAAETVMEVDNALYVYWTHEGSLLRSSNTHKYIDGIEGFSRLENKLKDNRTPAADVFFSMGAARFLLGIFRRAALQLSGRDFLELGRKVSFERYRHQIALLPLKQKIAGYLFITSKLLFYYTSRLLFSD